MNTAPLLAAAVLTSAMGCAPSAPAAPSNQTVISVPNAPGEPPPGQLVSQSWHSNMPDDPQLIFEHRRGNRNMPTRPLRQLSQEEADAWMGSVKGIDTRYFALMPKFANHEALRQAAAAPVEELREMIGSTDPEVQRVAISESVLRKEAGVVTALDKVQTQSAITAMWTFREHVDGQEILRSWKKSPSQARRYAAYLYLGTAGDPEVKGELERMAEIETRRVVPRSGPGAYQYRRDPKEANWPASARHILAEHYFSDNTAALAKYKLEPKFLVSLGTPEALKAAHLNVKSTDFYVRKALMTALGDTKPHAGRNEILVKGINDEEAQVRVEAARALAKVGDKSLVPALRKAYENPPKPKPGTGRHSQALGEILLAISALGGPLSADESSQVESIKRAGPSWR